MCPRHMVFASFLILWPGTPMNLLYAVSAQGNPLYQGKFGLHGRYQTYGQHSFIYDLIAAAYRRGVRVTLLVEGLSGFPLAEPLKKYAHVLELDEAPQLGTVDVPGKIQSENHRDPKRQSRRRVNTRWNTLLSKLDSPHEDEVRAHQSNV